MAGRGLDEALPGEDFTLRWIYLHMIEEYARHNGHADLLRERIDGATGESAARPLDVIARVLRGAYGLRRCLCQVMVRVRTLRSAARPREL